MANNPTPDAPQPASTSLHKLTLTERTTLLVSVLIISVCALTYELIVATLSSYLLGNSVTQFSFTIGLFLFAMGIGSLLSQRIQGDELRWFVMVELVIGIAGGFSALILYAVFTTTTVYYYLAMISISMVIGICSGLEIPLLTRIVATRSELSNALANILSVDYLGALLASLAFPLLLLPVLGITATAFLTGLFNILVAAVNLYQFRSWMSPKWVRRLSFSAFVTVVLMVGGVFGSGVVVGFFEQQLYVDRIIYRHQSSYQQIVITRNRDDTRMFLDGNLQFSSRDEYRYHEILVHPVMSTAANHERVAILGGGDGLVVRELLKYESIEEIVLIDLDPAVTDLGQNYPLLTQLNDHALADERVTILNDDAFSYISEGSRLFSVIIIDLPDPNNESLSKLYSEQFYRLLRKRLSPDGAFVTQATSPYFARQAFWSIAKTIEASDFHTLPLRAYIPSFGEWGFVIGTPTRPPDVGVPEGIVTRYLTPSVLEGATQFDPDTNAVAVEVNTLNNPILIRYYEQGWRYWE